MTFANEAALHKNICDIRDPFYYFPVANLYHSYPRTLIHSRDNAEPSIVDDKKKKKKKKTISVSVRTSHDARENSATNAFARMLDVT